MLALGYWDIVRSMVNDPCHELMNLIVMLLDLVSNSNQFCYHDGRRAADTFVGEEQEQGPKEWHARKSATRYVDQLCKLMSMYLPSRWGKMKKVFAHSSYLKIAHCIMLCGPLGIYLFAQLGLPDEIFAVIRDVLRVAEYFTSKVLTKAGLRVWNARMLEVKARMEVPYTSHLSLYVQT